jgi:hypothetical protein
MRPVYILFIAIALIAACQTEKNKPNANLHVPFRKDSLAGNWMIISLNTTSSNNQYENLMDSVINPMKEKIVLSAFSFQPEGTVLIDEGKVERTNGQWKFNSSKQLLIQQEDTSLMTMPLFSVTRYRNDSLTLENIIEHKKENLHIRYILKRLRNNDSVPNLFDPALNKWREKPLHAEDEAAIRSRLKQVLYYYAAYFANISGNKIPVFNIQKILCPILFYSGGIGLQKFHKGNEWKKIFYDNSDAEKAHAMLGHAFSDIKDYPDKGGNYVQEYVVALKMVADAL